MQYYDVSDIREITGSKLNKCYEIIRNLNEKYKERFPNAEICQGKVVKWFFEESMGVGKEGKPIEIKTSI